MHEVHPPLDERRLLVVPLLTAALLTANELAISSNTAGPEPKGNAREVQDFRLHTRRFTRQGRRFDAPTPTRCDRRHDASHRCPQCPAAVAQGRRRWPVGDQQQPVQLSFNLGSIYSVAFAGCGPYHCGITERLARRQRACTAPRLDCRACHQLGIALKGSKTLEVLRCQGTATGNQPGILAGQSEGDPRLGVGQHRRAHLGPQLVQVLVSEHETDAQAARLRQGVCEVDRQVQVVLELIDVDKDRMATLRSDGDPAEYGLPELRDDQAAEQRCGLRTEQTLTEIDEQIFRSVNTRRRSKLPTRLSDDGPHFRPEQQRTQLVHNRRDGRCALLLAPGFITAPERPNPIGSATFGTTRRRNPASVSSSGSAAKRHAGRARQRQQRRTEDVMGPWSPIRGVASSETNRATDRPPAQGNDHRAPADSDQPGAWCQSDRAALRRPRDWLARAPEHRQ